MKETGLLLFAILNLCAKAVMPLITVYENERITL